MHVDREGVMSSIQSDDMIKGRVVAMRSMIAQFQNEISQLEDSLRHRQQPTPSVPDGFILHDGNPITNHSMLEEVIWRNGETHKGCIGVFNWHGAKPYLGNNQEVIAYSLKAEKPAVPEGYIRHDGGLCPVDPETVERIVFDDGHDFPLGKSAVEWSHKRCKTNKWRKVIAYKLKPAVTEDAQERGAYARGRLDMCDAACDVVLGQATIENDAQDIADKIRALIEKEPTT